MKHTNNLIEKNDSVQICLFRIEEIDGNDDVTEVKEFLSKLQELTTADHIKDEKYTIHSDYHFVVKDIAFIDKELFVNIQLNDKILTIPAKLCSEVWQRRVNDDGREYDVFIYFSIFNGNSFINNNWIGYETNESWGRKVLSIVDEDGEKIIFDAA